MRNQRDRPIRFLLVEDDLGDVVITREVFAEAIANTLHVVHDGVGALDFLHGRGRFEDSPRPDLILLDLHLPHLDGSELLKFIRDDPALRSIPVVVMTTSRVEEAIVRERVHADAYITKPVDLESLIRVVRGLDEFAIVVVRAPATP